MPSIGKITLRAIGFSARPADGRIPISCKPANSLQNPRLKTAPSLAPALFRWERAKPTAPASQRSRSGSFAAGGSGCLPLEGEARGGAETGRASPMEPAGIHRDLQKIETPPADARPDSVSKPDRARQPGHAAACERPRASDTACRSCSGVNGFCRKCTSRRSV